MSYSYGLRRRRRRLPYRSRSAVPGRRRGFAKRRLSRRSRYKKRSTIPRRYLKFKPNTRPAKRLTSRRTNLGLNPLKLRHYEEVTGTTQWIQVTDEDWSAFHPIDELQLNEDVAELSERVTNNVTILPGTLQLILTQPLDTQFRYRILVLKTRGKVPVYSQPSGIKTDQVIQGGATWSLDTALNGSYARVDEQGYDVARTYTFNAIYDKYIYWDTRDTKPERKLLIKLPGRNVQYDPDNIGGGYWKNGLSLHIMTDATAVSATHTWKLNYTLKFL